jgi:Calcineurin-like phosphoesterase
MSKFYRILFIILIFSFSCSKSEKSKNVVKSKNSHDIIILPEKIKKIAAIGDLHGDLDATLKALQLAGAVNKKGDWSGGKMVVVQTGDILDRGADDLKIIKLFQKLIVQAEKSGGKIITILGNHEIMNLRGEFKYVGKLAFPPFDKFYDKTKNNKKLEIIPEFKRGRAIAFGKGGEIRKNFENKKVILILGNTVFVHGGLLKRHIKYGIEKINRETQNWIKGKREIPTVIKGKKSPTWVRKFSKWIILDEKKCKKLSKILKSLNVNRMVVGHSIQSKGITSQCNKKIWRIDVAMSSHYGSDSVEVLIITKKGVKALKTKK